jgi:uncharacterized repeat protein (TIGR03803 family)
VKPPIHKSTKAINFIVFTLSIAIIAVTAPSAQAQTFGVFYNFTGRGDGGNPLSGLIADSAGNLYGVTNSGGRVGAGVVFKLSATGTQTTLHNFAGGADGTNPQGRLVRDPAGDLYGTTNSGGASNAGTVFKVTSKGVETVLYSFAGNLDGANPVAGLTLDKSGNLYGTTTDGGTNGNGTVFELLAPTVSGGAWTEQLLYSFGQFTGDGSDPVAGVTFDNSGNLYGTTAAGGNYGYGTVYQLQNSGSGWTENVLHHFELGNDGGVPYAGLTFYSTNTFFGAATDGGPGGGGGGTIFELKETAGVWKFAVIYSLPGWGISGTFRNLLVASGSKIYGTTHCDGSNDAGTVYELTKSGSTWTYNSLYVFTGGDDGLFSFSNLANDKAGNLYGTTNLGGNNGAGVVFKITM